MTSVPYVSGLDVTLIGPDQLAQLRKEAAMQTEPTPDQPPVLEEPGGVVENPTGPTQEELDAANARIAELEAAAQARDDEAARAASAAPMHGDPAPGQDPNVVVGGSPTGTEEPAPAKEFDPREWLHRLATRLGFHDMAEELPTGEEPADEPATPS